MNIYHLTYYTKTLQFQVNKTILNVIFSRHTIQHNYCLKSHKRETISYVQGKCHNYQQIFQQKVQSRRKWHNIFKDLIGKNCQQIRHYPAKMSFRIEGEIKSFSDKQKLKEFITAKLALQEMLNGLL